MQKMHYLSKNFFHPVIDALINFFFHFFHEFCYLFVSHFFVTQTLKHTNFMNLIIISFLDIIKWLMYF